MRAAAILEGPVDMLSDSDTSWISINDSLGHGKSANITLFGKSGSKEYLRNVDKAIPTGQKVWSAAVIHKPPL